MPKFQIVKKDKSTKVVEADKWFGNPSIAFIEFYQGDNVVFAIERDFVRSIEKQTSVIGESQCLVQKKLRT